MKKLILICCFSLVAFASKAQLNFYQGSDTVVYLNQPNNGADLSAYIKFVNPTNSDITITWTRPTKELPSGWNTPGMCDNNTCLPFYTAATTLVIAPGDTGYIKTQIVRTTAGVQGCAYAIANVSEPGKPTRVLTFIHTSESSISTCSPMANRDFDIIKGVDVYPNPTSDYFNVKINNNAIQNVTITNIIGKKLNKYTFDINKSNIFRIEMDQLPNGVYMLQFADKKGNSLGVKKLTKQ